MNLLYVQRHPVTRNRTAWVSPFNKIRELYYLHNQDGYFIASAMTQASVKYIDLDKMRKLSNKDFKKYDAIIFHHLCCSDSQNGNYHQLGDQVRKLAPGLGDIPRILLLVNDNAQDIPPDHLLDQFQLVFKREPFKDLNKYSLSENNRDKIKPTILSCHLVPATIFNYDKIVASDYGEKDLPGKCEQDVFFSGMDTSDHRRELVRHLLESDIDFRGGIHERNDPVPANLHYPRLRRRKFYKEIRSSRINLAVEGYGQFTYRHWELWCLSTFMISSPTIRDVALPFEAVEGFHFVVYEDPVDLEVKIKYYLNNPDERRRIASNGRKLFEQEYNFHKHGTYIRSQIEKVLNG